jgi:hypothetical protein
MTMSDSIETRGFLSKEMDSVRETFRARHADLFSICEAKSDAAITSLFKANIPGAFEPDKLHIALALGLWCRCVSACQAALLLVERGMVPEAQILVRSAFEFLFFAAATAKDSAVMESLMHGDTYARYEQAKSMLKEGLRAGELTLDHIESLNQIIAQGMGKKQLSVFEAADKVGLAYLHSTVYRGMSLIGSHATAASTDSVFDESVLGVLASFGPSDKSLPFCIGLIDKCLALGGEYFDPILESSS